jgi:hypothetical protein
MNSVEAETKVREYLKQKYPRLESIFFYSMYREGDVWVLEGEVEYKHLYFFTVNRAVTAQVNMDTGAVTAYKEAEPKEKVILARPAGQ